MADGWSIVTGRPGVCVLISGPGVTNALTPIAQAYHDSRPMLVLASTTPTDALGKGFGPLHDLPDQAKMAESICAFSETVTDPSQLPALIERAFNVFASSRPRPVHIAIPMDVLAQTCEPFVRKKIAATKPTASPSEISRAAEIINSAQNPVVIAGGGCINASSELAALAQALDAPVLLTGNAKGVMPSSHALCAGNCLVFGRIQRDVESADVVVVVGTELSDTDLYNGGRALSFTGKVVRIDIDPEQISRRTSPTVSLVGDAANTLRELTSKITKRKSQNGQTRAQTWRNHAREKTNIKFQPWLHAIEKTLPSDAIVALDSTQLAYSAHWWLPATQSRSWLAPYGFGTLGCALPMAIGASIAAPTRPVLAITGDGGWLFTVAEMAGVGQPGVRPDPPVVRRRPRAAHGCRRVVGRPRHHRPWIRLEHSRRRHPRRVAAVRHRRVRRGRAAVRARGGAELTVGAPRPVTARGGRRWRRPRPLSCRGSRRRRAGTRTCRRGRR